MPDAATAETFRTDDMALATVLVMHDHEYTTEATAKWDERKGRYGQQVIWCFPARNGLGELVSDYRDGTLEVEPREFVQALAAVRNAMFTALGRNGR